MKPIDGHAMIARVEALYRRGAVDMSYYNIVKEAVQMEPTLEIVRTSDRVNVTRCRDCKYSDVIYDTTLDTMPLKCLNIRYGGVMPDWYCEHGERRDEGETGND